MIKKIVSILAHVILILAIIAWLEQGLKWFIRNFDPVYQKILAHKTMVDKNHMGESVLAVRRTNGDMKVIEGIE